MQKGFSKDKQRKDGLSSQCRECRYEYVLAWSRQNREKWRQKGRDYYKQNKEEEYKRIQQYSKTYKGYLVKLIAGIKQRCENRNHPRYCDYGGRGIKLCFTRIELEQWLNTNKIDPHGLDIHRIKDENYTLDNIAFLTKSEHTTLHNLKGH